MFIYEALKSREKHNQCIYRKAWRAGYLTRTMVVSPVAVMATNSPNGCILITKIGKEATRSSWNPTADDLMADDWKTCYLI